jgi:hypothetical protein
VDLVRTDVLEERIVPIIRVKRIGKLGTLAQPHSVTSEKMAFFSI